MTLVPPWTIPLRAWQERAAAVLLPRLGAPTCLAMATPGAGKTTLGLRLAHALLTERAVERVVVTCPTVHVKGQWATSAHRVGIALDPDLPSGRAQEAADFHGCAVTYAQVAQDPQLVARACARRRTLVLLDEIHHAGDGRTWAAALQTAFEAAVPLALSGTPFRSDQQRIPFIAYEEAAHGERVSAPDFRYSYAEALRDHVCRPIIFPAYEGELRWKSDGIERQATFADPLGEARARERLKTALLREDWLGQVIQDAHAELIRLRTSGHPDAGGLIVTLSQEHARSVAGLVQTLTGIRPAVAVSDDPEASATIHRFAGSGAPWLVAVNMVSEGVDIPRLRVGIFATNVLTEMYFRQVVGRFVRWQPSLPRTQRAALYVPEDPVLIQYAREIQAERDHVLCDQEAGPSEPRDLFGALARMPRTFEPLAGVARPGMVIGDQADLGLSDVAPGPALHEHKEQLRAIHRALVGAVARKTGLDHRRINLELIKRTGSRIESATVAQLERRILLLERWRDRGWEGGG